MRRLQQHVARLCAVRVVERREALGIGPAPVGAMLQEQRRARCASRRSSVHQRRSLPGSQRARILGIEAEMAEV